MKHVFIVRAFWDAEAKVWVASGENFGGLATEAESVDALIKKIPPMIEDLLEANNEVDGEIPVRLLVDAPMMAAQLCG